MACETSRARVGQGVGPGVGLGLRPGVRARAGMLKCWYVLQWSDSDSENTSRDIVQPLRPRRRGEGQEGEGQEQDDDEGLGTDVVEESRSWLSQHLVFPYWEGRNQSHDLPDTARSAHPSCQLAGKWACHVMSCDPFHRPVQAVYVSENQIVRETIW